MTYLDYVVNNLLLNRQEVRLNDHLDLSTLINGAYLMKLRFEGLEAIILTLSGRFRKTPLTYLTTDNEKSIRIGSFSHVLWAKPLFPKGGLRKSIFINGPRWNVMAVRFS